MDRQQEEVTIVGAEALKQLTITVVKAKCCKATSNSATNQRPAKKEELHSKVLHSVRQDETAGVISSASQAPAPVCTVSAPSPAFPRRQLSSSVDCSPPAAACSANPFVGEAIGEGVISGTELQVCRPNTLSLCREISTTSSGGSGKTTPCNIPERSTACRSSPKESLVSTYPPGNVASCYMGTMQASMAASVDRQPQCRLEGLQEVHRQALARQIAEKLRAMGDQLAAEADLQQLEDLLDNVAGSYSWSWVQVARIFRSLSQFLARYIDGGSDMVAWDCFSDIWKLVVRNLFGFIADNGGWQSFMRWAESDLEDRPHPILPTSLTPDLSRRRNTIDAVVHYSTPQVPRRTLPVANSTPFLTSSRGERGSRVLSLTEEGVFQMEERTSFQVGGSQEQQEEELQGQEDATFGSLSSFSDLSVSPTSVQPAHSLLSEVVVDQSVPSAFDRNRSRSMPCRRRPHSTSTHARPIGTGMTEVIAEQERSVDSGLEAAFSEASLASADSCTSLNYSRLGVSATCILEAVRSMLLEK